VLSGGVEERLASKVRAYYRQKLMGNIEGMGKVRVAGWGAKKRRGGRMGAEKKLP